LSLGLITFHGPGQLVAYPIFNMTKANLSVRQYVYSLEKVVIDMCERYEFTNSSGFSFSCANPWNKSCVQCAL